MASEQQNFISVRQRKVSATSHKMAKVDRYNGIPFLYTRGTHYEVGFDVGRTFKSMIQSYLPRHEDLNNVYIKLYETPEGRAVYEETLACVRENFPQYVREMEGTAAGAEVDFYKLFLVQMDEIMPKAVDGRNTVNHRISCSSICINEPGVQLLGHTEDSLQDVLNHFYFVSAHIIEETPQGRYGVTEERFTSLCYAGQLPGYTMSYNHHGLVFTINTLSAKFLKSGKTPRTFITRAMLSATNFVEAQTILRDNGVGAADGCSLNMTFLKQEGSRLFHNAEMGPVEDGQSQSQLNILTASSGEHLVHVNKYVRMPVPEVTGLIIDVSDARLEVFEKMPCPKTKSDILNMLGDQSNQKFPVYHTMKGDPIVTIAVGIFDCIARTWTIWSSNPKDTEPLMVLPLVLKD